jgi:hypothetical protein
MPPPFKLIVVVLFKKTEITKQLSRNFSLFFRPENGEEAIIWQNYEDAGNVWNRVDMPLDIKDQKYRVVFQGQYTDSDPLPYGNIAIDDVSFTPKCR